jgi:hypothetical protein
MKLVIFVLSLGCAVALAQAPASPTTSSSDPQLAGLRARMSDNLSRLPNYTCLMTVDRSSKPAGSSRGLNHIDTIRLEVAEAGTHELWDGQGLP